MAARASMAALIARVRKLIAESGTAIFSDDDIQDKLDETRHDVRYALLVPKPTYSNALGIQYNDYYYIPSGNPQDKPVGMWEADEVLIWGDFTTLTPTSSDELVGHWTFSNQLPPVLIAGKRYDIYRAAADLLDYKLASLAATQIDFSADGQTFHLSQQLTHLEKLCADYRRKMEARAGAIGRSDSPSERPLGVAPNQGELAGPVSANVPFLTGN